MISRSLCQLLQRNVCKGSPSARRLSTLCWAQSVAKASNNVQIYVSKTYDPYLNLSVEQFLLENAPATSVILFFYVNRPCVVIGRNQNPWLEVNLKALEESLHGSIRKDGPSRLGKVDFVRRRSGGGTVFHDHGNMNWSVICPSEIFTRDRHAEMIVRALRKLGMERVRVNERHDIVLDQGDQQTSSDLHDLHRTPWTTDDSNAPRPLKVSGSAYKLTRGRALHHGTCLLTTPSLDLIPHYLRSPARDFIKAKGVESVSSPVGNLNLDHETFQGAVRQEFMGLYCTDGRPSLDEELGEDVLEQQSIKRGWDELRTPKWLFDQTPQFTFGTDIAKGQRHDLSKTAPEGLNINLDARYGQVIDCSLSFGDESSGDNNPRELRENVEGRYLRDPWTWTELLGETQHRNAQEIGRWLDQLLPTALEKRLQ